GWDPELNGGRGSELAVGAPCDVDEYDLASIGCGTRPAGRGDEQWVGLAHCSRCRHQLKKKLCSPQSKIGPTSQGAGRSGKNIKIGLIRRAWSSLTRLGRRPT